MLTETKYNFDRLQKFLELRSKDVHPEQLDNSVFINPAFEVIGEKVNKGDKVLDVGCGHGYALDKFKEYGAEPIGITLCDDDFNKGTAKGHDVRYMDMSFLEFEDETFDIIWARQCLEHSIFPFFTLSELSRVLKKGGWIYIEVPSPNTPNTHEIDPNHYSVFDYKMWYVLMVKSGFDNITVHAMDLQTVRGDDMYYRLVGYKI